MQGKRSRPFCVFGGEEENAGVLPLKLKDVDFYVPELPFFWNCAMLEPVKAAKAFCLIL